MTRTHDLKTWPTPFNQVLGGLKPFEIRVDDRNFAEGDLLNLCEWEPYARAYTGRELTRRITCITRGAGPILLPDGLVVLGMEDPEPAKDRARLGLFLHDLARALGVPQVFGAVEEEALLAAAKRLVAMAGDDARLSTVLDLVEEAHEHALRGTGPRTKACLGEGTRLLRALIDGRA